MARKKKKGNDNGPYPGGLHKPPFLASSPSLEAERRASRRGLRDLRQDLERESKYERQDIRTERKLARRGAGRERADIRREAGYSLEDLGIDRARGHEDLGLQRQDLDIELGRGREDISFRRADSTTSFTRDLMDLAVARQRGGEDFDRAIADLTRNYGHLAERQADQIAAAGVQGGGATAQAERKRAANLAHDRQPVETAYRRHGEDLGRTETRRREDFGTEQSRFDTAESRLGQDYGRGVARLDLSGGRLEQDFGRGTGRVQTEAKIGTGRVGQDLQTQIRELARARSRGQTERYIEEQRGIREQQFGERDITAEQVFQARELHPGVYSRLGRKRKR